MEWKARSDAVPGETTLRGGRVRLVPLAWPEPGRALARLMASQDESLWRYMRFGPFADAAAYEEEMLSLERESRRALVIENPGGEPLGTAAYLRIRPKDGSAELGSIAYSHLMQRSPMGTEAIYLMMRHLFDDLGWRRCEWQCNAANTRSYRAAERLGFTYEGTFRQDNWVKGENRDTAWFSVLDGEWPAVKSALEAWLAPENFDAEGRQRQPLRAFQR